MIIKGIAYWCKLVGEPQPRYQDSEELAWSVDVCNLDDETIEKLKKAGMKMSYIKDKGDDRGKFLSLSRNSVKTDGEAAKKIEIVDDHDNVWPEGKLIGNGSEIYVSLGLNKVKYKGEQWLKPSVIKVMVWEHAEYKPKGFPKKETAAVEETSSNDKW